MGYLLVGVLGVVVFVRCFSDVVGYLLFRLVLLWMKVVRLSFLGMKWCGFIGVSLEKVFGFFWLEGNNIVLEVCVVVKV